MIDVDASRYRSSIDGDGFCLRKSSLISVASLALTRGFMKSLTLWIVACAATIAPSVYAQDQSSLAAIRAACTADAQKFCAGVQQGGGRIVACLKEHKDSLSDGCKEAAGLPANAGSSSAPSASSPASPPDSVAGPGDPAPAAPAKPAPAPKAASKAAPAKASPAKAAPAKADSAAGEKFVERVITDTEHGGMRAITIRVPEKWRFEGKMEWHYNWTEFPMGFSSHAENPDKAEAFFQYPLLQMEMLEYPPQLRQFDLARKNKPGDRLALGGIYMAPQPPVKGLAMFIQQTRPNTANFKWLGQQELPGLAKALHMDPEPNQRGVAIKVGYDLNGQPVEEAFFGVYYLYPPANKASSAGIRQTNWGFQGLQSFRAPAGTLEKRMSMFCVIAKSVYVNPEWGRLAKAINDKLLADFNAKLKLGWDQIRASQAIMKETMRQQAAFTADFNKQEEVLRNSGGGDDFLRDGGARSAADHFDDLIRGVDTVNDPSTGGTKQLSNLGQYHFTDGFGNYRTTDDPNYTPEAAGEVGSWTQMSAAP